MAYEIGFVDNTGSEGVAHWQMLLKIKTLAEANGWTTLRYLNPTPYTDNTVVRELILRGVGLGGDRQIFVGFRTYQNQSADYYNLSCAGFTGYVVGNTFTGQPGYFESGVPAHNNRIDYWLAINPQRITFGLKVGTPVYEHGYAGFFLPYANPGQFPYPLVIGGMLNGTTATRFSEITHSMYAKGSRPNFKMRFVDGVWTQIDSWPWNNFVDVRDTDANYPLRPVVLNGPNGIFGELDGVYHISGFNNAVENTLTIGGVLHVVIQDVGRTGATDYLALRMN